MAGLRERRQKETRADILRAGRDLFLEKGYEATTMEQIAEKAVVGAGTLYNYFPSKDDIFLSVMSDEILIDVEKDDQDENSASGYGAEDALLNFLNRYVKAFKLFRKSLWRDVMSIVFAKSGSALFKKWFTFDMRFVVSLEKKLQEFKKDGCLPASFDCGEFERLIEEQHFPFQRMEPRLAPEKIEHLLKVDKAEKFAPSFSVQEISERIKNEVTYVKQLKSAAVITGFDNPTDVPDRAHPVSLGHPVYLAPGFLFPRSRYDGSSHLQTRQMDC